MKFANITYLWGVLGIFLPIAIHLWNRRKVKTIKIGSIKILQASVPKQTSSIKLNEWWLLFLRIVAILTIVLLLSEPSIKMRQNSLAINYLVEPSLLSDKRMHTILDTLDPKSVRLLAKGFPLSNEVDVSSRLQQPLYWQLAQQFEDVPADSIVVFSKGFLKGIKGRRPSINANTKWFIFDTETLTESPISAIKKPEHVVLLSAISDSKLLYVKRDSVSISSNLIAFNLSKDSIQLKSKTPKKWLPIENQETIKVAIVGHDSLKQQYTYLKSAYQAISKFLDQPIKVELFNNLDVFKANEFRTTIVFNKIDIPKQKACFLLFKPDLFARSLIEKASVPKIYYLTQLLNSENIVSCHLPEELLALLRINKKLENRILAIDHRSITENEIQPMVKLTKKERQNFKFVKISHWIWLVLIFVLVSERILSKYRKQ